MKRTEMHERMKKDAARVTELGQVIEVALKAEELATEDLQAVLTAADVSKQLADDFKADTAGAQGKEQKIAPEFEKALRTWSFGARLLCDGLGGKSATLTKQATAAIELGPKQMAEAIKALA